MHWRKKIYFAISMAMLVGMVAMLHGHQGFSSIKDNSMHNNSAYYTVFDPYAAKGTHFPDFDFFYKGATEQKNTPVPMGPIQTFEARKGHDSVSFRWSSGTGDIGPVEFVFAGTAYTLSPYNNLSEKNENGWMLYPSQATTEKILDTPALFMEDISKNSKLVSSNDTRFGFITVAPAPDWPTIRVTPINWSARGINTGASYNIPAAKTIMLPIGAYEVSGDHGAVILHSASSYVDIRSQQTANVTLRPETPTEKIIYNRPAAFYAALKQNKGQRNVETLIDRNTLTDFGDFKITVSHIDNRHVGYWVCFDFIAENGTVNGQCVDFPMDSKLAPTGMSSSVYVGDVSGEITVLSVGPDQQAKIIMK